MRNTRRKQQMKELINNISKEKPILLNHFYCKYIEIYENCEYSSFKRTIENNFDELYYISLSSYRILTSGTFALWTFWELVRRRYLYCSEKNPPLISVVDRRFCSTYHESDKTLSLIFTAQPIKTEITAVSLVEPTEVPSYREQIPWKVYCATNSGLIENLDLKLNDLRDYHKAIIPGYSYMSKGLFVRAY